MRLVVEVTEAEHAALRSFADALGCSLSDTVHALCGLAVALVPPYPIPPAFQRGRGRIASRRPDVPPPPKKPKEIKRLELWDGGEPNRRGLRGKK